MANFDVHLDIMIDGEETRVVFMVTDVSSPEKAACQARSEYPAQRVRVVKVKSKKGSTNVRQHA